MVLHKGLGPARRCCRHLAGPKPAPVVVVVVIMVLLEVAWQLERMLPEALSSMRGCWRLPFMPLHVLVAFGVAGGLFCLRLRSTESVCLFADLLASAPGCGVGSKARFPR